VLIKPPKSISQN